MSYWLGLDFESEGLDLKIHRITEIGAVLWDVEKKMPVEIFNKLICDRVISSEIERLTGITQDMINRRGVPLKPALGVLFEMMSAADYIVAHNGTTFDKPILEAECAREKLEMPSIPWIDTCQDVPYPPNIQTRKLVHLSAEHDFLNPFKHRAVFDVLTMMTLVSQYNPQTIIMYNKAPNITIRAMVSYEDRAKASSKGYRWNAEQKLWLKVIKDFQLEEEIKNADFQVVVLDDRRVKNA